MKTRTLFALAAASCLVACEKPPPVEEAPLETPPEPAVETAMPAGIDVDQAFIDHMHVHAERMDEMMFALEDGDLEAARSPATWLSRHKAEDRIPDEWLPYLEAMREEARQVENATDLGTARAAAERISIHCQECHAASGLFSTG